MCARPNRLALGLLVPALCVAQAPAAAAVVPTAVELLERSIEYHDPDGRFLSRPHRLRLLETRPDAPDRHSEVLIDVRGQRFEMVRAGERVVAGTLDEAGCEMTLDGRADVTPPERQEHRLTCERLTTMRDYYTYLWGLPMKLADPGTRLGRVTETEFGGRAVYDLRVTYDEGVGRDVWYFYFDRTTSALVGYRFYHDETTNDGEVIALEGELAAYGMRLPQRRTWHTHGDDRLLGTDTLTALEPLSGPTE